MQWSNTASIASGVWRCLRHRPHSKQCSIWNRVRCASPKTRPSKASPCKRYKVVLKLKWEAKPMHRSTARRRAPALPLCSKQRDLAKRAFFPPESTPLEVCLERPATMAILPCRVLGHVSSRVGRWVWLRQGGHLCLCQQCNV